MAAPLEVALTKARKVVLDVDGDVWRVAYYRPEPADRKHASRLLERAKRGSEEALEELRKLPQSRTTGKAPALVDALQLAELELREATEISNYVLSCRYAEKLGRSA